MPATDLLEMLGGFQMDAQINKDDPDGVLQALRSLRRRRLEETEEARGWVHHVADLDGARVISTELERPLTPLSRVARIAELGRTLNDAVLCGPSQQLTAKRPYIESPPSWLMASNPESYAASEYSYISWERPRDFPVEAPFPWRPPGSMYFYFSQSPPERALFSLSISGISWPGMNCRLRLLVWPGPRSLNIGISSFSVSSHTIDIIADMSSDQKCEGVMQVLPGIQSVEFYSISLRDANAQWHVDPGPVHA
jgi:hypothetical protein